MSHVKYVRPRISDQTRLILDDYYSYKLHTTSRQLHEWTRSEKMKLKDHEAKVAKGDQTDPGLGTKASPTEAGAAENFEGEMDNFQSPLVRPSRGHPVIILRRFSRLTICLFS